MRQQNLIFRAMHKNGAGKVFETWQWAACTHDEVARDEKLPLLINIDVSPMPLVHAYAFGNIVRIGEREANLACTAGQRHGTKSCFSSLTWP